MTPRNCSVLGTALAAVWLAGCTGDPSMVGPTPTPSPDAGPPPDGGPPPDARPQSDALVVPEVPREVDGRLTLNELMASNGISTASGADWVELYNPTDVELSLAGYSLTDDLTLPFKAVLPVGLAVPPRGHLVLWLDNQPALGADHVAFTLPETGGTLALARSDGSYIDRVSYGRQETDLSAARTPDGSQLWTIAWHVSPGLANPAGTGAPMELEDLDVPPEAIPAAGDLSERILGYDVMLELTLEVSPASAAALEVAPRTYVPATIVYDGRSYGPVGLRLKGQNSFQPFSQKPSLRINVDEYRSKARFFGLKDLTLNNMDNDFSMMHERLAYRVAREVGLPASRANHALLTVNGQFYGLYTNVETVKRVMIARHFANSAGPLYEGTDVDLVPGTIERFEHESGPDDRAMLRGLADALTSPEPEQALFVAGFYANLDQFRRFWAMSSVVGQFDGFPYSNPGDDYFVYIDPDSNLVHFLPWGMDETFYSSSHDVKQVHSVLARQCSASPACFEDYANQVWDVLATTERIDLLAERDRVAAQIAPWVALDLRKPYSTAEVLTYQAGVRYFLLNRRAQLTTMLPAPTREPRP